MHDRQFESDRDPGDEYDPEEGWHINGLLESMKLMEIEEVSPDVELAD